MTRILYRTCIFSFLLLTHQVILGLNERSSEGDKRGKNFQAIPHQKPSGSSTENSAKDASEADNQGITLHDFCHSILRLQLLGIDTTELLEEDSYDEVRLYNALCEFEYPCTPLEGLLKNSTVPPDRVPDDLRIHLTKYKSGNLPPEQVETLLIRLLEKIKLFLPTSAADKKSHLPYESQETTNFAENDETLVLEFDERNSKTDRKKVQEIVTKLNDNQKKQRYTQISIKIGKNSRALTALEISYCYVLGDFLMRYYSVNLSLNQMTVQISKDAAFISFIDVCFEQNTTSCARSLRVRFFHSGSAGQNVEILTPIHSNMLICAVAPILVEKIEVGARGANEQAEKDINLIKEERGVVVIYEDHLSRETQNPQSVSDLGS